MSKELLQTPTTTDRGIVGRPRKEPPADAAERIIKFASEGSSKLGIAKQLDCDPDIFNRWLKEYPDLQIAFNYGREQERKELHNNVYQIALHGKDERNRLIASFFLLKARHGYREGEQGEAGSRVNISFTLPGAMSVEQFTVNQVKNVG